ncbi:PepSY domain-containing protein, partial [Acinetobacter baumannii]
MVMRGLHFGDFAGWVSKAVWFALGAASAYVAWSGLRLWLRRRDAQVGWRVFGRLTAWIGGGLPLSMAASAAAYFCALRWGDP